MRRISLFIVISLAAALPAIGQESPLQVVMDGREAASASNLTEAGLRELAQSAANIVLYVCGALAVVLTMFGLWELYRASDGGSAYGGHQATTEGGWWKIGIAGLMSVPALVSAILVHAVL